MGKQRLQPELEPIRFGNDGELASGKFCAYCGNRNSASDNYCWHCAEYIADQGPDLTSRLARISRRGSTARVDTSSAVNHMIGTQSPNTFGLLFGRFFTEVNRLDAGQSGSAVTATTSSEDSVRPHLPLSVRLAQVRRHVPRYSRRQWHVQKDVLSTFPADEFFKLNWRLIIVLLVGWFIGMAIFMAIMLILTRGFS